MAGGEPFVWSHAERADILAWLGPHFRADEIGDLIDSLPSLYWGGSFSSDAQGRRRLVQFFHLCIEFAQKEQPDD